MGNLICLNALKGVGVPCDALAPLTDAQVIILVRPGFTFTNAEAMDVIADWNAAIANKDIFVIPNVFNSENQKVEDGMHTSNFGEKTHLWEGARGERYLIKCTKEQHEILRTYSNKNWDKFIGDRNNNIHAVLNDDGTIGGSKLSYFHVFNQIKGNAELPTHTPIEYQEDDPGEWDSKGCYLSPSFRVKNIKPITHVTITAGTVAANAFTLTAAYVPDKHFESDGTAISVPLSGLVVADVEVIDQTGAVNTLASVVESTTTKGTYVVTGATLTAGTVRIKPTAANLYESDTETLASA